MFIFFGSIVLFIFFSESVFMLFVEHFLRRLYCFGWIHLVYLAIFFLFLSGNMCLSTLISVWL